MENNPVNSIIMLINNI